MFKEKSVPKYLDEKGDFVSSCFRTCEGNVGSYAWFVSYKMTFWLALPSWLPKVPLLSKMTTLEGVLVEFRPLRPLCVSVIKPSFQRLNVRLFNPFFAVQVFCTLFLFESFARFGILLVSIM